MALVLEDFIRALRLNEGDVDAIAEATRLMATTLSLVTQFAPEAPFEVQDEAQLRLAGYLYDSPTAPEGNTVRSPLMLSGAAGLLAPWRQTRAGIEHSGESATTSGGIDFDTVQRLIRDAIARAEAAGKIVGAYVRVRPVATVTTVAEYDLPRGATSWMAHEDIVTVTLDESSPLPDSVRLISDEDGNHRVIVDYLPVPDGVNAIIIDASHSPDAEPFFTGALPWAYTFGRASIILHEIGTEGTIWMYGRLAVWDTDSFGLAFQASRGNPIPAGLTLKFSFGRLGGGGDGGGSPATPGVTLAQVRSVIDAEIAAGNYVEAARLASLVGMIVQPWAVAGSAALIPEDKLDADIPDVPDWALDGNAATIPNDKLATPIPDVAAWALRTNLDKIPPVKENTYPWARTPNTDRVPANKTGAADWARHGVAGDPVVPDRKLTGVNTWALASRSGLEDGDPNDQIPDNKMGQVEAWARIAQRAKNPDVPEDKLGKVSSWALASNEDAIPAEKLTNAGGGNGGGNGGGMRTWTRIVDSDGNPAFAAISLSSNSGSSLNVFNYNATARDSADRDPATLAIPQGRTERWIHWFVYNQTAARSLDGGQTTSYFEHGNPQGFATQRLADWYALAVVGNKTAFADHLGFVMDPLRFPEGAGSIRFAVTRDHLWRVMICPFALPTAGNIWTIRLGAYLEK